MLQITQLNEVPSIGALLGSQGQAELIKSIDKGLGSNSYFGSSDDRFGELHKSFITKYIEPIRKVNQQVFHIGKRLVQKDYFRPLTTPEELREAPPCMHVSIVTHTPLYNLLRQGRIVGYGYDPENLVDAKDQYDRLVDKNGVIFYGIDEPNEQGEYWYTIVHEDGDPELSIEDRIAIENTREYIDKILQDTELDPTSYDNITGNMDLRG